MFFHSTVYHLTNVTGSKAHKELEIIVRSPYLCKDIGKLSPGEQTSGLEAYHRVVTFFAPKSLHFFFNAMEARFVNYKLYDWYTSILDFDQ